MPDESKSPRLYKSEKDTPFFHQGNNPEMSLEDAIDFVLNEHAEEYVCKKQPMHVQQNAVFLITTIAVRLQDLPADDNGVYRNNGTRVWTYKVKRNEDGSLKKTMIAKNVLKPDEQREYGKCLTIRRTYRKSKSCNDFSQIITYAEESGNVVNNLAALQYVLGERAPLRNHSSWKQKDKTVPYLPMNLTTRGKTKECVQYQKPTTAMGKLCQQSNMMNAESSAAVA